jgi:hypothetical protein
LPPGKSIRCALCKTWADEAREHELAQAARNPPLIVGIFTVAKMPMMGL